MCANMHEQSVIAIARISALPACWIRVRMNAN
jgi:hypothetical protein